MHPPERTALWCHLSSKVHVWDDFQAGEHLWFCSSSRTQEGTFVGTLTKLASELLSAEADGKRPDRFNLITMTCLLMTSCLERRSLWAKLHYVKHG